jgi:SagB-type dehydrogenase family enzyme
MKVKLLNTLMPGIILLVIMILFPMGRCESMDIKNPATIKLPNPQYESTSSVESALLKRRSVRRYLKKPLSTAEISQLLWAAQGITHLRGFRTAPSAGALYPLEIYIVAGNVNNLTDGVYKYKPIQHELIMIEKGDKRKELCDAALSQRSIKDAPAVLVFCAVYQRTTIKYGQRGIRYIYMEIGHSAQNVCLQAVSLSLGTVTIGAFNDKEVKKMVHCDTDEHPLYIMPVGKLKTNK